MIRAIVAIDEKRGLANDHGIPWQGKIPTDVANFRKVTLHGAVMMGQGWYKEQLKPLPERRNLVATSSSEPLRDGFEKVTNAREYLANSKEDIWVGGGAALFASTIDLCDELYVTQLQGDFKCTKFFPAFHNKYSKVSESESITEGGISFTFQVWKKN